MEIQIKHCEDCSLCAKNLSGHERYCVNHDFAFDGFEDAQTREICCDFEEWYSTI